MTQPTFDLGTLFAAAQMLGGGSLALKDVANENAKQVEALRPFDPIEVAATFGGLLTMPELQSNCVRLEVLAHLAVAYCQGHKKPPTKEVSRWFFEFGSSTAGRMEDPAEDVFVSNIASSRGNFRVIDGIWESAGFYLQRIINVVEGMPAGGDYDTLRSHVYTLLALSDLACERAKLTRYQLGNQNPETSLSAKQANSLNARRRRVCFETDDLKARGISIENLGVFIFNLAEAVKLRDESVGNSTLERFPLLAREGELFLVLPTAISVTIRRYVIEQMIAGGMRFALASALAREYGEVFANIPLLGGKRGAPIELQRTKNGLVAGATTSVDVGRHLNLVCFGETFDDIEKTGVAGFQPNLEGITNDVDECIDHAYEHSRKDPNFRDGLTLVVGCGIGRGAIDFVNDRPRVNWRVECLSASDLYELSWLHDFKPLSLWRLLDAQDKVEAHGIHLHNINGLLNMVAWARKLDGHLVPHRSLPDDFTAKDAQLGIMIQQNSLRDLRYEVATSWDAHVVQDVTGRWVRVRKDAGAFFEEDRQRPIYGSKERIGRWLPGVFLTPSRAWWGSIEVPEETSGHNAYQRWKMLMVWIPRMAPVLEEALPQLPQGPLLLHAKFEGNVGEFEDDPKPVSFEEAKADIRVSVDEWRDRRAAIGLPWRDWPRWQTGLLAAASRPRRSNFEASSKPSGICRFPRNTAGRKPSCF